MQSEGESSSMELGKGESVQSEGESSSMELGEKANRCSQKVNRNKTSMASGGK